MKAYKNYTAGSPYKQRLTAETKMIAQHEFRKKIAQ